MEMSLISCEILYSINFFHERTWKYIDDGYLITMNSLSLVGHLTLSYWGALALFLPYLQRLSWNSPSFLPLWRFSFSSFSYKSASFLLIMLCLVKYNLIASLNSSRDIYFSANLNSFLWYLVTTKSSYTTASKCLIVDLLSLTHACYQRFLPLWPSMKSPLGPFKTILVKYFRCALDCLFSLWCYLRSESFILSFVVSHNS